ncbi:VOC family protein [Burkholderia sola]|uniref:VOC family protein n=1 Tax=Burkholderia TaxID=32008 RepID=UPI001AE776E8|nr:VOC family protein [Burkholderia sp. AcTa6-5]MBP0713537.1 VOC family protein [Burkholderia sp. AcTa6-5]
MTLAITRVILYVHDVALLKSFYQRYFNLPVIEEIDGEWVVFKAGAVELALHLAGEAYQKRATPNRRGTNAKFVFSIAAGIAEHREQLAGDGVAVQEMKRYEGFAYQMYDGLDPEGNVFQVMQLD